MRHAVGSEGFLIPYPSEERLMLQLHLSWDSVGEDAVVPDKNFVELGQ